MPDDPKRSELWPAFRTFACKNGIPFATLPAYDLAAMVKETRDA